jgi:DNA polymerase elongation subunit (family B)
MSFYTNIVVQSNQILVRGVKDGHRFQERVPFKPKLFVPKQTPGTSKYRNLFGEQLEEIQFGDIADAREFIKSYDQVSNMKIHGMTNWQYQYITETYPGQIEFNLTDMSIWTIDIETTSEQGFPSVEDPQEEVLLITLENVVTKDIFTFGRRPWKTQNDLRSDYRHCPDESDLLKSFLAFWNQVSPDIITGWNSNLFDIPYLVSRTTRLLGETTAKQLSPWRTVRQREINYGEKVLIAYEVVGVSQLDYLELYKKFTYGAQESYKLDYICRQELGVGKLDNPHDTFKDFYTKDWDLFVDYNIIDTQRVTQLEDKMKLIELALTMSFDAKCNFNDVYSAVRTWDCTLYNHLWDQQVVVHPRDSSRPDRSIEGAYVQEPVPGQYDWVVSFDATSLYPSIIMQYNMSPETLVRPTEEYAVPVSVDKLLAGTPDLGHLAGNDECLTANGYHFSRGRRGLFPEIVEKLFKDRQLYKSKMIEAQKLYEETKDPKYQNDISRYTNFQMARKIQLNSLFGAWANYYFRYFDDRIAEGITITGQYIIRTVGQALDDYLNKICGTKDFKYSFYSDTDSCYITLDPLVKKFYADKSKQEIVGILDQICEDKITGIINKACGRLADYTNAFDRKIIFKREAIADRGIWVAKKRYAINVYNNEGVTYAEPKLKVMGLEIVRSSTPEAIRTVLKDAVRVAITQDEAALQDFVSRARIEYQKLSPEEIAFPRGVNGMRKYASSSHIYAKGCPMHVRGALLFNHYIKNLNVGNKYEPIQEGEKIRFLYLLTPNRIKENCIGFTSKLPEEFQLTKLVDYDTMWNKSFIEPLNGIIEGMGWNTSKQASLFDLFN